MKQFNKLFAVFFLALGAMLSSCSDDESKLASEITIDGEKIKLENGYVLGYQSTIDDNDNPVSVYQVVLTEEGLLVEEGDYFGNGTTIIMYIASSVTYELKNGTYTFEYSESLEEGKAFGYILYNLDAEAEEMEEWFNITSGTLKLSKSGNSFRIKFSNLVLERNSNGAEVDGKGSWEGSMDDESLISFPQ